MILNFLFVLLFSLQPQPKIIVTGSTLSSANQDACTQLQNIHQQALQYFNDYRGQRHEEEGLFNKIVYFDYELPLWDAESSELNEMEGYNSLSLTYCRSTDAGQANRCFNDLVNRFESCKPGDYQKHENEKSTYVRQLMFTSKADSENFFLKEPTYTFFLKKNSDGYRVELNIHSKIKPGESPF